MKKELFCRSSTPYVVRVRSVVSGPGRKLATMISRPPGMSDAEPRLVKTQLPSTDSDRGHGGERLRADGQKSAHCIATWRKVVLEHGLVSNLRAIWAQDELAQDLRKHPPV